jgi:hypothetical protein
MKTPPLVLLGKLACGMVPASSPIYPAPVVRNDGGHPVHDTSTWSMITLDAGVSVRRSMLDALATRSSRIWTGALAQRQSYAEQSASFDLIVCRYVPLWAAIMVRAIDNPIPMPCALVVKKG